MKTVSILGYKTPDRGAGLALVPSFAQFCPQPTPVDFLTDADGHFMEIVNFYEFLLRLAGILRMRVGSTLGSLHVVSEIINW